MKLFRYLKEEALVVKYYGEYLPESKYKKKKKVKPTWNIWSQMPGIQWAQRKNTGLVAPQRYSSISWVIAVYKNARENGRSGDDYSMSIEFRKRQKILFLVKIKRRKQNYIMIQVYFS